MHLHVEAFCGTYKKVYEIGYSLLDCVLPMLHASGGLLNYLMRGDLATDIFCNGPVEDTLFKVIAWQKGPRREYTDCKEPPPVFL